VTLDDSQLMRRVQEGEFRFFDVLVERYRPSLVRVATGALSDAALAEDVVQETFLAVFAARKTFNPSLNFRTWLWTILLNLCRRHRVRLGRRREETSRADIDTAGNRAVGHPSTPETGLAALLKREQSEQLQRLLNELPDVQADAIRLRFFAELTYDEIARSMGVSLGGAKLRVRTALAKLSRQLRGDEIGDGETRDEL